MAVDKREQTLREITAFEDLQRDLKSYEELSQARDRAKELMLTSRRERPYFERIGETFAKDKEQQWKRAYWYWCQEIDNLFKGESHGSNGSTSNTF